MITSGFVDTSVVYYGGRHWVGVNSDFAKYPSTVQRECFENTTIFNFEKRQIAFSYCFSYQVSRTEGYDITISL